MTSPTSRELLPAERAHARDRANRLTEAEAAAFLLWSRRQFGVIELAGYLSIGEVTQRLYKTTLESIQAARGIGSREGVEQLQKELPSLGIVQPRDAVVGLALFSSVLTARRYVSAWTAEVNASGLSGLQAARQASGALTARAQGIVTTETSQAFSVSRRKAVERAAKRADVVILERWDATLDHSTCPLCEFSDGETIKLGDSFAEGIPGLVHPRCRCTSHYLYESPETAWLLTS